MSTRWTQRIVTTLVLIGSGAWAAGAAPTHVPSHQKLHPSLTRLLQQSGEGQPVKAWVFFEPEDKGQTGEEANRAAVQALRDHYHPRSVQRRQLRRTRPGLFDVADLPVSSSYVDQIRATGAQVHVISKWLNAVSVRANAEQLERIAALPFVKTMQPVRRGKKIEPVTIDSMPWPPMGAAGVPTVYGGAEAQLTQINLIALHDLGFTADGVVVGILDTGFKRTHVAFNEPGHLLSVVAEHDFVDDDSNAGMEKGDPAGQHSHGTYILGVLGAYKPHDLVGAAYDASFILCKTEDTTDEYQAEEDNYVAGLEFIEANGGDMATASLGYIDWYTQEDLNGLTAVTTIAVNIATGNGIHVCNAAGNAGHDADPTTSNLIAPSDAFHVLTCGAVNDLGEIASFSSDGPTADGRNKPEVLARGINTQTVASNDDFAYVGVGGTSLSTPLVAGVVACLIEAHPDWTVEQMRAYLFHTAADYVANQTFDPQYVRGYGVINALAAHGGDCNENTIDDETDIANGTSADCNLNLIPDECDVALGTSMDQESNGIPDECEHSIPAVSTWGLFALILVILTVGTIVFREERRPTVAFAHGRAGRR